MGHLTPHLATSALLVIDVQNDFLDDGPAGVAGTVAIVPALVSLLEAYRRASRPIVHAVRLYRTDGRDVELVRRGRIEAGERIVAPGSDGAGIAPALVPRGLVLDADVLLTGVPQRVDDREVVLCKPRWSAFHRTMLDALLVSWGVDTVVVAGCNLPNCPRATLFDATAHDYRAVLVTDAVSGATAERVADLEAIGVVPMSAAAIVAAVAGRAT